MFDQTPEEGRPGRAPSINVLGGPLQPCSAEPLTGFYAAEEYHQDFAVLHPSYPYIVFNDLPKVDNLKQLFPVDYRDTPVTAMASSKPGQ